MTESPINRLRNDLSKSLPNELVNKLLDIYVEIEENLFVGKHEPAELNAAKFCEVIYRILEFEATGSYTSFGTHLKDIIQGFRNFENQTKMNDSIRFHIPRVAIAIYNIRNKRGVGHVGGDDVSPNEQDSMFVSNGVDWITAELIRIHYQFTFSEAQQLVDSLAQRRIPLVFRIGNKKRVLSSRLNFSQCTLLLLASEFPNGLKDKTIWEWLDHSNFSAFKRDVLHTLHEKRLIEYDDENCIILPPGLKLVEENYANWANPE